MSTILIADDDLITVKNIFNNIMKNNKEIKVIGISNNGIEVLEYMEEFTPDILLLDLMMPKMNGIEVLDKLIDNKEKYLKKTKIIIISSYIDKLFKRDTYREYIYDILPKPYNIERLVEIIEKINEENNNFKILSYINNELNKFNFNQNTSSFKYLKDTIYFILTERQINFELENDIYKKVAKINCKKNEKIIKWAIEKLMENMYTNTKYNAVKTYFNLVEDKKPTTKLFIRYIVNKYIDDNTTKKKNESKLDIYSEQEVRKCE